MPIPLSLSRGGEAGDLLPGRARVRALPEARLARPEVEDAGQVGIDGQPLAHRAAVLVAAHLHRHVDGLPGVAAIVRAEDGAVADPRAGVRPRGQVDLVGVDRIGRQALDAEEVRCRARSWSVRATQVLCRRVPAVGAADVGARVDQILLDRAEDDAADEAAAEDGDVLPVVGDVALQVRRRPRAPAAAGASAAVGAVPGVTGGTLQVQTVQPGWSEDRHHRPPTTSTRELLTILVGPFIVCRCVAVAVAGRHRRSLSRTCRDRRGPAWRGSPARQLM